MSHLCSIFNTILMDKICPNEKVKTAVFYVLSKFSLKNQLNRKFIENFKLSKLQSHCFPSKLHAAQVPLPTLGDHVPQSLTFLGAWELVQNTPKTGRAYSGTSELFRSMEMREFEFLVRVPIWNADLERVGLCFYDIH